MARLRRREGLYPTLCVTAVVGRNGRMDEQALVDVLLDLETDLAYLLGAVTGARIEEKLRPVAERVQANASKFAEILRARS
jgi:hypothetical protein